MKAFRVIRYKTKKFDKKFAIAYPVIPINQNSMKKHDQDVKAVSDSFEFIGRLFCYARTCINSRGNRFV